MDFAPNFRQRVPREGVLAVVNMRSVNPMIVVWIVVPLIEIEQVPVLVRNRIEKVNCHHAPNVEKLIHLPHSGQCLAAESPNSMATESGHFFLCRLYRLVDQISEMICVGVRTKASQSTCEQDVGECY